MKQISADVKTKQHELDVRVHNAANWFYWIGILSILNSLAVALLGKTYIVSLCAVQALEDVMRHRVTRGLGQSIAIFLMSVLLSSALFWFGYKANRKVRSAFAIGMIIYAIDGALYLLIGDLWRGAFHAIILYYLSMGYRSLLRQKESS